MRTGAKFFALSAAFSAAIGISYWLVDREPAGTTLLGFMGIAPLLVAAFMARRSSGRPPPEDRDDAAPGEGAGSPLSLPHGSAWPAGMAAGAVVAAAGLIFGAWLFAIGAVAFAGTVIGWMSESRG